MNKILDRMTERGLELPHLGSPDYSYVPFTLFNNVLYVSGQISRRDDGLILTGKLGEDSTIVEGVAAAEVATLNLLARIQEAVGLENVQQILKLTVWVNSSDRFHHQPTVAEGASQLLVDLLGAAGRHARTALPAHTLPKNALVELDAVIAVR